MLDITLDHAGTEWTTLGLYSTCQTTQVTALKRRAKTISTGHKHPTADLVVKALGISTPSQAPSLFQ